MEIKGFVELPDAREVRETEKAFLLDYGDGTKKQSWFPKKAIRLQDGKYFVAIWFNKKVNGETAPPPTKTELVNKYTKKRLIQVRGDNVDCLLQAGEVVLKGYEEYRKGSPNSGRALSEAVNDLSHWIEEAKKDRAGKAVEPILN